MIIILTIDLTALKFNGLLNIDFFRLNPMVIKGFMSIKLGMVPDHGGITV